MDYGWPITVFGLSQSDPTDSCSNQDLNAPIMRHRNTYRYQQHPSIGKTSSTENHICTWKFA